MIYSIIPFEQIFYETSGEMSYIEVTLQGERVVLQKNKDNTYTIDRLISTNPKSYLKPELMPGTGGQVHCPFLSQGTEGQVRCSFLSLK